MITLAENKNIKSHVNTNKNSNKNKNLSFKSSTALTGVAKAANLFIKSQENLSSTRFNYYNI